MTEYTPTTEQVREAYAAHGAWKATPTRGARASNEQFDRWHAAEIARAEKRGVEKARKVVADELAREDARLREYEDPITSPMLRNYLGGLRVAIGALDRAEWIEAGDDRG